MAYSPYISALSPPKKKKFFALKHLSDPIYQIKKIYFFPNFRGGGAYQQVEIFPLFFSLLAILHKWEFIYFMEWPYFMKGNLSHIHIPSTAAAPRGIQTQAERKLRRFSMGSAQLPRGNSGSRVGSLLALLLKKVIIIGNNKKGCPYLQIKLVTMCVSDYQHRS